MEKHVLIPILASLLAIFTAITCSMFEIMALRDCITRKESKMKRVLLFYFFNLFITWAGMLFYYTWHPVTFISMIPFSFAFIAIPVIFYHFIFIITRKSENKFPLWHYAVPCLFTILYTGWLLFLPPEALRKIILIQNSTETEEYEILKMFFFSCSVIRCITSLVYGIPCIIMLAEFYHKWKDSGDSPVKISRKWFILYIILSVSLLINGFNLFTGLFGFKFQVFVVPLGAAMIIAHMVIIAYNSFDRYSLLFITVTKGSGLKASRSRRNTLFPGIWLKNPFRKGQVADKPALSRETFEDYFVKQKLFLNPKIKITDLVEPLQTNRTHLSVFINSTYRTNFSRLVGKLRLEEMERLKSLPGNSVKPATDLCLKAGFPNYRNYCWMKKNVNKEINEKNIL